MRNHPRLLLWSIVVLTLLALFITLPKFPINIQTPVIPILNKKISINREFQGFVIDYTSNGTHVHKEFPFRKGLDLQGGTSIILQADMSHIPQAEKGNALEGVRAVLENRVNLYGVSEPVIQTITANNDYRLLVELPGVNSAQTQELIGTTAQLSFWESATSSAVQIPQGIPVSVLGNIIKPTSLTGKDLQTASVTFDPSTGQPQVQLTFTNSGSQKFADITKRNVGKIVAIVLDDEVIEAPRVNEAILAGNAVITGNFTTDLANQLAIELKAGALPVPLKTLSTQSIGATLGLGALEKSLFAGILGFLIVVLFMSILYGRLGIIASFALTIYTLIVLSLFKLIPVTLTLAGIAGFILSIGMAVDANILIFERIKEELREGKSRDVGVELGFVRAWPSIRDSNISTLITSVILYKFGTGIVRGFALTLAIGVVVSMFSAIVVTRTFIRVFYKS